MWFSPEWIVLHARPRGKEPLSIQRANDLLGTGTPIFDFTREEWDAYTTCQDYEWTCGMSDVQWWHEIGSKRFSTIYEAALHYLWLPPLVTACDSVLSVLSWKYTSRQARIGTDVVATQMFLRGNEGSLRPKLSLFLGEVGDALPPHHPSPAHSLSGFSSLPGFLPFAPFSSRGAMRHGGLP